MGPTQGSTYPTTAKVSFVYCIDISSWFRNDWLQEQITDSPIRQTTAQKHEPEAEEEAEFLHPADTIANPDKALSKPNGTGTMF